MPKLKIAKAAPKSKSAIGLVTTLLQLAAEGLRLAGEIKHARRVEAILADRPSLTAAESRLYRRAVERLGR